MIDQGQNLAGVLVDLSDTLVEDFCMVELTQRLCGHAVALFGVDAAGVMLLDSDSKFQVLATSSEEVEMLQMFQIQRDEGPCIESHNTGRPVLAAARTDLLARWPNFGHRVVENFNSVYAFPMRLRGSMLGAMSMYSERPKALGQYDVPLGQALADIATISILQYQVTSEATALARQLQYALDSRVTIEQAKGMYSERHSVSVGAAFEALRRYSQNNNMKLADTAAAFLTDQIMIPHQA